MIQSTRAIVSKESLVAGLNAWAWVTATKMMSPEGAHIVTYPALQRDSASGVTAARLQVVPHLSGGAGNSYLLNVRAGWTPQGNVAPADLMAALGKIVATDVENTNKPYLLLKNKYQITISLNSSLESHCEVLDKLSPAWRLAKTGTAIQLRNRIELDIEGIRFASDDTGKLLFKKDGTTLYNFSQIDVKTSVLETEVDAVATPSGSTRVAIDQTAALAALGISVSVDEAFKPADTTGADTASRKDAPKAIAALTLKKALKAAGHDMPIPAITPLLNLGYSVEEIVGYIKDDELTVEDIVASVAA